MYLSIALPMFEVFSGNPVSLFLIRVPFTSIDFSTMDSKSDYTKKIK